MAQNVETVFKISRNRANYSREAATEMIKGISSAKTLYRYELPKGDTEHIQVPADIVEQMMDVYDDEYLGYLYLMDNPVARRFIPENVERMGLLQAVVQLSLAIKSYMKDLDEVMDVACDGKITPEEAKRCWSDSKNKLREVVRAYIALECADGADK